MPITQNISPKEKEFLIFQKKRGVDAQTALGKLKKAREAGLFQDGQKEPQTKASTPTQTSQGQATMGPQQPIQQKTIPIQEKKPEVDGVGQLIQRGKQLYGLGKATLDPAGAIVERLPDIGKKTVESAKLGTERIKEAGEGLATGKYNIPEAAARGGAGALQTAFSPVAGAVGQAGEEVAAVIPDDIKEDIKENAEPTIEGVQKWYENQSPEQKRRLANAGIGLELLSYFVGAKAGGDALKTTLKSSARTGINKGLTPGPIKPQFGPLRQSVRKATDLKPVVPKKGALDQFKQRATRFAEDINRRREAKIPEPTVLGKRKPLTSEQLDDLIARSEFAKGKSRLSLREKIAGLTDKDKTALKKITPDKFDEYMKDANLGKFSDETASPYAIGASKANKAMEQTVDSLQKQSKQKLRLLKDADTKINSTPAKKEINNMLEDTFNVKGVNKKTGEVISVKGRAPQIEKKADIKALDKLDEVLRADTPIKQADKIRSLQKYVYDNYSSVDLSGISKDMRNFLTRATGVINENLKKQLPEKYRRLMKGIADDIKLKEEIDRVFKPVEGVTNKGEMAMKRLSSGTTTTGEVRRLAQRIREATGIDLINEARLRQLTMDLVGDPRAKNFFSEIGKAAEGGIVGLGKKGAETIGRKVFRADPEKIARSIADKSAKQKLKKEALGVPKKSAKVTPKPTSNVQNTLADMADDFAEKVGAKHNFVSTKSLEDMLLKPVEKMFDAIWAPLDRLAGTTGRRGARGLAQRGPGSTAGAPRGGVQPRGSGSSGAGSVNQGSFGFETVKKTGKGVKDKLTPEQLRELKRQQARALQVSEKSKNIRSTASRPKTIEDVKKLSRIDEGKGFTDGQISLPKGFDVRDIQNMTPEQFRKKIAEVARMNKFKRDIKPITKRMLKTFVLSRLLSSDESPKDVIKKITSLFSGPQKKQLEGMGITPRG